MMKKLLEAMTKFAGEPEQKPGEQWKGTDKDTPGKKLVGDSIIKDLSKGPTAKTKEQQLAEEFAKFMEDDLGVEPKRPHRTGSRAEKVGARGHKEQPRYTTVKDEVDEATAAGLKVGDHITANTSKGEYPGGHKSRAGKVTRVGQTGVHIRPDDGGEIEYHPYKIVKKTVKDKDVYETTEAEYDRDELFRKHDAETDELGVVGIGGEFAAMAKAKKAKRDKDLDEGWNTGSDRVHLSDDSMAYWNGKGRLQAEYDELYNQLVPASGAAETIQGEVLRAASKIVYRHFNDGDEFNKASFDQLKAYIGQVTSYDDLAEKAVEFALNAEGRYTPNRGWDSLDVMDYGPTDDNDGWDEEDEYDDEDDTSWDEEEDELEEGMEEFAKAQAKKRAEKRKSIPWPKEVPTDAEQERNRTRDEEENDPHPYTQVGEGEHDAEFIDHEDNWYNMADWARAEFKKGKSVEEVIKYLRDNDYLGPRDINNFMKTVSGEKWNESADMFKAGQRAIKNIKSATQQRKSEAEKMAMAQSQIDADRENERDRFSQEELYPSDDSHDLDEGAADVYSITSERNGRERSKSGTLAELIEYYGYTLETGKSYEHERGNRKINLNPKSIESLVQNLNNAKSNAAANGRSNERFYVDHGNMAEGKHFRTAYGWAGGRNEKTGKMYKHPDQIKADREAKKAATAQQSKDAFNDMLGGNAADLTRDLKIREGWEADLAKSNRERMKKERAAAKPMKPIAKAKPDYSRVFQDINSAIGDTFPDGDPMDALMRKYRDSYGDLNIDLLNKACRVNGAKSYHDYVAKVWQQHMQDNPDLVQGGNPWIAEGKSSESISKYAKELVAKMGHEEALEHALMMANMSRDTKWFPVIRYIRANKQGVAENGHPQHYVDRYNKDLERKIDKDFDPDYDRKMSDQEFEAKLKQRGKERNKGIAEGQEDDGIYIGAKVYHRSHQTAEPFEVIQIIDDQRVRVIDDVGNKAVVLISELVPATVSEGWESGEERTRPVERDPDAEYDARRQEKLDAEADKAPKTTTYQCVGRGPNDEPNYKFGPEHNTSEEAVAYRKKLMANPKTPNPRDIGIRTISKVAKGINEDVTSTDPLEGALLDAIHELIGQGHTDVDPMVLTNMVVAATSQPFLLKDLVDANNNSQAVQHYIDSISPSKVKFSSDMLTVKNEDPAKDKAKAQAGVSSMASRAANRSRLGESTEISKQGFPDAFISLVYRDAELNHDEQPVPMTKKPTKNDLASNVIVVKGKDGNFYGARAGKNEGYTVYGQVDGKVGKQYVSSIREVASWIKSGEYFAIPLNSTYYKSREAQRYSRGQDRQSSEYSAILTQMNNTFTPAIKQRIEEYIDYIYANLRKLSNEPGRYTFNNSSDQTNALQIVASLEQLVKAGFTRNTVDEYLRSLGKRDVGFGSHYTNIDRFLEQMKEPLAQAKFAKTILDQAKGLYNKVKDMLYAPTVNALTAEGVIDSSSNTMRGGVKNSSVPTVVNNSSGSLYMASAAYMKQQAAKYQKHVAGTDSTPAGPDTSKFSATRSGMIAFEKDVTVHGGQYGFDRFYQNFVKIGGNVDYDIKKKMEAEFRAWLATATGEANSAYVTPDRYYITIGDANGTNWGGYGLSFKKIDDNEWNKKYASLFNQSAEGVNEDIAISGRSTPLVDKNDLIAKRKELQKLQMSPWAHKDPKVRTEIIRRKAELMKQAEALGIDESRAHKLLQNKFQQIALQRKLGSPESDAAYKQHVERMKKSGADYVNNTPNTIYKKVDEFAAPGMEGPAATTAPITTATKPVIDPAVAAKAAVATSTLKAAVGGTPAMDQALAKAAGGTATSTDVKALAPALTALDQATEDPKLAAMLAPGLKTAIAQAKTTP